RARAASRPRTSARTTRAAGGTPAARRRVAGRPSPGSPSSSGWPSRPYPGPPARTRSCRPPWTRRSRAATRGRGPWPTRTRPVVPAPLVANPRPHGVAHLLDQAGRVLQIRVHLGRGPLPEPLLLAEDVELLHGGVPLRPVEGEEEHVQGGVLRGLLQGLEDDAP